MLVSLAFEPRRGAEEEGGETAAEAEEEEEIGTVTAPVAKAMFERLA